MRAILLVVFLAGCGSSGEDSPDNHGYGFAYDAQGASGLKLRYTPVLQPGDQYTDAAWYETEFENVKQCTGISAPPPPFVIVLPEGALVNHIGYHYSDPSLIVVTNFYVLVAFRHEAIHYLLGYTGDSDPNHVSPLFTKC